MNNQQLQSLVEEYFGFPMSDSFKALIVSIIEGWKISQEEFEYRADEILNEALGEAQSAMCG